MRKFAKRFYNLKTSLISELHYFLISNFLFFISFSFLLLIPEKDKISCNGKAPAVLPFPPGS